MWTNAPIAFSPLVAVVAEHAEAFGKPLVLEPTVNPIDSLTYLFHVLTASSVDMIDTKKTEV